MELWQNVEYTSEISYLDNVFIYELDIQKANINILYSKGVIDKQTYSFLYNSERMMRQVYVGKLQRDTAIANILKQGIIEAKKNLFEANDIKDYEVLSIKNDAVFLIGRIPRVTEFGLVKFIPKNTYTGFYRILNYEFYYFYNSITKEEYLHVKGISDKTIELHEDYFYQFLKDLFYTIQCNGIEVALRLMKSFYTQYINLELPVEYYRRFNVISDYVFKVRTEIGTGFAINEAGENQKSLLDINDNLRILIELQKILSNIYFNKYR